MLTGSFALSLPLTSPPSTSEELLAMQGSTRLRPRAARSKAGKGRYPLRSAANALDDDSSSSDDKSDQFLRIESDSEVEIAVVKRMAPAPSPRGASHFEGESHPDGVASRSQEGD